MNNFLKNFIEQILDFNLENDYVFIKDDNLNYVFANKKFCEFFNLSLESLLGNSDTFFLLDPDHLKVCKDSDLLALNNNFSISNEAIEEKNYKVLKLKINLSKDQVGILCLAKSIF